MQKVRHSDTVPGHLKKHNTRSREMLYYKDDGLSFQVNSVN